MSSTEIVAVAGRPTIRVVREFEHAGDRVWRAITDVEELVTWFRGDERARWTDVEPGVSVHRQKGDQRLTITLVELGDDRTGLELELGFPAGHAPSEQHVTDWELALGRLEAHLHGYDVDAATASKQAIWVHEDGTPVVRFHRRLEHSAAKVWRTVAETPAMNRWFPARVRLDPTEGGEMAFDLGDGTSPGAGEVLVRTSPREFAFDWDGDIVAISIVADADGAGATLGFSHASLDGVEAVARTAAGWHVCLDALAAQLADPKAPNVTTGPTAEWQAAYDAYVARGFPHGAPIPGADADADA